jgi:signal transduction histidine kinase
VVVGAERRLLEFNEVPLVSANSTTVGYATDATALEAVQDNMAAHIAAHAEVLEGLSTAIAIYGGDRRLKFFNSAYAELTGIEQDMLRGEPTLGDILEWQRERRRLPEYVDFPSFKQERDRWFNTLIDPNTELMHLPDETTIRAVTSPHPLGGLVFAMEDVTDRLALESSYNTLIEVQRETLNKLHEGIAVFGGDGRLKLSNPELARVWNLSEGQLGGDPHISDLIEAVRGFFSTDTDWEKLKQRLVLMVTERAARHGRLRRADNSYIRYASVPLPDGNTLLSFLDVSDSARVERALRERNLALESAGRIKSEFIGNVSYELRTPLNAIVGFTEILDNRYFGELTERQAEYVECILQASTHLMTLIDDILDLATIEADYMELDIQPVGIRELLDNLMEVAQERASQAGLKTEIDCPDDIGTVAADAIRLRQAMFNLVSNAIQFTPAGGVITLSARRTDREMLLTVSDTGIGIAPEDQARVFERFERAHPNARESGTGLGLALVKSLIELHGGTVELDSEPGRGTSAICRLPIESGYAAVHAGGEPAAVEKPKKLKKVKKAKKTPPAKKAAKAG